MNKSDRAISWLTGLTTLAMALLSFILSFNALTDLALQYSVSIPPFIPLIIEGGVVVFSLNALWRSLHAIQARWQWTLIIGSSLLAGTFNVIHVQADVQPVILPLLNLPVNPAQIMAALPSLFLLLSFETFLSQLKHGVKFSTATVTLERLEAALNERKAEVDKLYSAFAQQVEQRRSEVDTELATMDNQLTTRRGEITGQLDALNAKLNKRQAELDKLATEVERLRRIEQETIERTQAADATVIERRQRLVNILSSDGDIGPTAFAERLNVARGTVYSDLKVLNEQGVVHKNGNGWKVTQ